MFRHPKYYKELRKARNELAKRNAVKEDLACSGSSLARNNSDQVISSESGTPPNERAPGPGLKRQATSYKYPGPRPISNANKGLIHKRQASSTKPQASSSKLLEQQATSVKRQA